MDCIQFSATADGSVKVERVIAGVVVDRFIVRRNKSLAIKVNKSRSWITKAQMLLMEPSAGVVIPMLPLPSLELTQAEKIAALELAELQRQLLRDMVVQSDPEWEHLQRMEQLTEETLG